MRQSDAGRRRKLIQGGEKTEERQDGQHGRYLAAVVLVLFPPAAEPAAKAPPPAAADRPVHDRQPHQLCAHRSHWIQRRRADNEPPFGDTEPDAE